LLRERPGTRTHCRTPNRDASRTERRLDFQVTDRLYVSDVAAESISSNFSPPQAQPEFSSVGKFKLRTGALTRALTREDAEKPARQ